MRTSFGKIQFLLFAIFMLAMTGCGGNSATSGQTAGGVSAKLAWPADGKTSAKTSAAAPAGVATVRIMVSGNGVPTVKKDFPAASGGGTVEVYPGSELIVSAIALDAAGARLYEGAVANVTVTAGVTTDVGIISLDPAVVKTADEPCLACHETTRDVTGQNLVADFKQSGHYSNTSWVLNPKNGVTGTGCAGCHGPSHNDKNPSASGRCYECHTTLGLEHWNAASDTGAGDTKPARYLSQGKNNCSACHEPHNPINGAGKEAREGWAESGHGNPDGLAWKHYDFTGAGRGTCARCHTAAGFKRGVDSNFTINTDLSSTTLGKQVLTCDACHSSNDFKNSVRSLQTAYAAPYTPALGVPAAFPAKSVIGTSEVCIPCHAGLISGSNITALSDAAMGNTGFQNSHYMAAAGLMYVKEGYTNFVDPTTPIGTTTYGATLKANTDGGSIGSTHRILGTAAMATDSHVGGRGLVTGGPCVTCHMAKGGHSWEIDATAFNEVCVKCHTAEGTTTLTAANFKTVFIEEQQAVFQDAIDLALATLKSKFNISYNPAAYPYFYDDNLVPGTAVKDWTRGGTLSAAEAKNLMGACFNINLVNREPAAFVHARSYTRRLLYDSIDFLDDKTMNLSVTATAVAWKPVLYVKGATANDPATTEAYKYLAGYNRTTGAWNNPERP